MIFGVGTKVRLKHTGEKGVILSALNDNMFKIKLEDGFEIPVHEDDLENLTVFTKIPKRGVKKQEQTVSPDPRTQYTILKSLGIQAAFDPIFDNNGVAKKFIVKLINDTRYDFSFDFELTFLGHEPITRNDLLKSTSVLTVGEISFDRLNDAPQIDIKGQQLTTAGLGEELRKTLKIKPKVFFSKITTAPLINHPVHLFLLFSDSKLKSTSSNENVNIDLKSYAKANAPKKIKKKESRIVSLHDIEEFSTFSNELDLHIEKLTDNSNKMNKGEILRRQMWVFENYMNQAARLGVKQVFVIHGIGKGKLKQSITESLKQNHAVSSFKNEFHPKYGWGATEVLF